MGKFFFVLFAIGGGIKVYVDYYPAWKVDWEVKRVVEQDNKQLPRVINNVMRMDKIRYEKHVVYITSTILDSVPINDDYKPKFEALLKDMYCTGMWKGYADNKVTIESTFKFEASNYRGIEWVFKDTPQTCV